MPRYSGASICQSQPAEGTTLKKPGLRGMFPASQLGAPTPGTRNCNSDWVSVRENKLKKQKPTPSLARRISKPCMPVAEVLPLRACWYARNHTLTITSDRQVMSCIVSTDITFNNMSYTYTLRERNSNSKYAQLNVYILTKFQS